MIPTLYQEYRNSSSRARWLIRTLVLTLTVAVVATFLALGEAAATDIIKGKGAEGSSWNGCYLGGSAGYESTDSELLTLEVTASGYAGSVAIGCDYQPHGSSLVMGIRGEYGATDADGTILGVGIEGEEWWTIVARIGVSVMDDNLLLYILGGYGQQDTDIKIAGLKDPQFEGFIAGAGAEAMLTDAISIGPEFQAWYPEDETVAGLAIEQQSYKMLMRMNWRFGTIR